MYRFSGANLSEEQWRSEPEGGGNAPAWYLWHTARWLDVVTNLLAGSATPLLERDDWHVRLSIAHSHTGTGMPVREARALSETVNIEALGEYYEAALAELAAWLEESGMALLSEPRPDAFERASVEPEVWSFEHESEERAARNWWSDRNTAFFVRFTGIGHTYMHLGEMQHITSRL